MFFSVGSISLVFARTASVCTRPKYSAHLTSTLVAHAIAQASVLAGLRWEVNLILEDIRRPAIGIPF